MFQDLWRATDGSRVMGHYLEGVLALGSHYNYYGMAPATLGVAARVPEYPSAFVCLPSRA